MARTAMAEITLKPVDRVEILSVMDNSFDVLMGSTSVAKREPLLRDRFSHPQLRAEHGVAREILRRHGVHLNDLRRIGAVVERASLEALKVRRKAKGPAAPGSGEYEALVEELARKEQALSELTVEYTLLKKSERLGSKGRSARFMSTARGVRR